MPVPRFAVEARVIPLMGLRERAKIIEVKKVKLR